MRTSSVLRGVLGAALMLPFACGSDAVGIDSCRKIEAARCRAAEACGDVSDAKDCERYYRDQCLHGLAVPEPSEREVDRCTAALDAAAECARADDDSVECEHACAAVADPGALADCSFLEDEADGEGGAPGSSGGKGDSGGTSSGPGGSSGEGGEPAGGSSAEEN